MISLLRMERYQLLHSRVYLGGLTGIFILGLITADSYLPEVLGPDGGAAASLADIFNGMVYDSTFPLILVSCLLALLLGQEFSCRTLGQEVSVGHPRRQIFAAKTIAYLLAFNLMALLYPLAGCLREFPHFGLRGAGAFLYRAAKAVLYSLGANSAMFLIAIFVCCLFQNTTKAVAVTAGINFVLGLYLGYGMLLGLPVGFLPTYQIRKVVSGAGIWVPAAIAVCLLWAGVLTALSWRRFRTCDLR